MVELKVGQKIDRDEVLAQLISVQYERNDYEFSRGKIRVRGDIVEVHPAYRQDALRIEFFDDEIEKIRQIDPVSGETIALLERTFVYPAKHFLISPPRLQQALQEIEAELSSRLAELESQGKLVEAQRLKSRTRYDMEMMKEMGICKGIENYSRVLSGRPAGSQPFCLMDYFPDDFVTIIDESHVTVPQLGGMYEGDRARKEMLVAHGFRLASCLDNRPLKFHELEKMLKQRIYVSATPGPYERKDAGDHVVEQIIRPTGIIDPPIFVRSPEGQVEDLIKECRQRAAKNERVLVTTLTKRMSEDLCSYCEEAGLRVKYLHSDIETFDRTKILQDLRLNKFDCLIGVNLLREGLDLPEVSLVAIFDADKQGFLRSQTSLIQTAGRAARNINGIVIMYADSISPAMRSAISECERRRKIQIEFNTRHGITPTTIEKAINLGIEEFAEAQELVLESSGQTEEEFAMANRISDLEGQMESAARNLEFEKAARIRDKIKELNNATRH
jgi:excinuclease ABC subunit B